MRIRSQTVGTTPDTVDLTVSLTPDEAQSLADVLNAALAARREREATFAAEPFNGYRPGDVVDVAPDARWSRVDEAPGSGDLSTLAGMRAVVIEAADGDGDVTVRTLDGDAAGLAHFSFLTPAGTR